MVRALQEQDFLSTLPVSGGDVIATENHTKCRISYYNRFRSQIKSRAKLSCLLDTCKIKGVLIKLIRKIESNVTNGLYIIQLVDHNDVEIFQRNRALELEFNKSRL